VFLRVLGRDELFCANCQLEFQGFALPGVVDRNHAWDEEDMTNRRRSPRYHVRLPAQVELIAGSLPKILNFSAQTKQVGGGGMSLICPAAYETALAPNGSRPKLKVTLELPQGSVTACVEVVYSEPTQSLATRIAGTRITQISQDASHRYTAFLNSLRTRKATARA
jgi:hypothetical protein